MSTLLTDIRVVEISLLGGGAATTQLADLGADIIKVESPSGDYVRGMTWPIIEGVSLMHLHMNRGKRSVCIDMKSDEGKRTFERLVVSADAVVAAMRPGAMDRMGYTYDALKAVNPRIVLCSYTGYGATGPYRDMPAHGIAFDTYAGIVSPEVDDHGFTYMPEHVSIGINAGSLVAGMAILAAVHHARAVGEGSFIDIGQSDVAAAFDWYRSETWLAYDRPEDEVTGNPTDDYERRAPGTAGMREGVRYQIYRSADGYVLFMASERKFWRNFCDGVGRLDLFERWPGEEYADHARGNRELQAILTEIFRSRTSAEWLAFGNEINTPIAPVNSPKTVTSDPQFRHRTPLLPHERFGAEMLPFGALVDGRTMHATRRAPSVGEHTDEVLIEIGMDRSEIARLREAGIIV